MSRFYNSTISAYIETPGGIKNEMHFKEKKNMGQYTTRQIDNTEMCEIIGYIRDGYLDHRPNPQIAVILTLEANLGCRIGDICSLTAESFINDGGVWKICIDEQKTHQRRCFIVPDQIKDYINCWMDRKGITTGALFTIKPPAVWKALRQVTDFLDMENVSSHSFRKSAANRLYEQTGHDIEAVREYLNHSSTRITQAYIRRSDAQLESAISNSVVLV